MLKKLEQYLCKHEYIKVGETWETPAEFHLCINRTQNEFIRSSYRNEICIKCGKVLDNIERGKALVHLIERHNSRELKNATLAEQMYRDRNRS